MSELNQAQASAVAHTRGPLLIFAGAGSGKTRTLTYRIANLLASEGVAPYRVLAVTFTNKAAGEMRQRLEQLAGPEIARDLWVGTFHSVCARLLRRYHDEVGLTGRFVIYDDSDQKAVIARVIRELGADERSYPPKFALGRICAQKREGRGVSEIEGGADPGESFDETLFDIYRGYQRALACADAVDFEDLILNVMRIAESDTAAGFELRERFDHVLVDEFQDTNQIQYRLVRALASRQRNLCVVGDDDQAIYRWRGADVRLIRSFRRDFPDATVVKLEQNYRSTANIVSAALAVIKPSAVREPKQLWTQATAGEPVRVLRVSDEKREAELVASGLRQRIDAGTPPNELAVFYRIHAQSRVLEEALRRVGVPYQVIGGMKFFERAEVKDLLSYLRLVENPRSDADLLRIANVPARGIGNKTLERLFQLASRRGSSAFDAIGPALQGGELGTAAKKKLLAFKELIDELRVAAARLIPQELASLILEQTGYRKLLREDDTAESDARLENLEELLGSIKEYESEAQIAGDTPSVAGYLEQVSLVSAIDAARDGPAACLMTVHSAKGLEFDTVFLTGMEQDVFPYRGIDANEEEELDEERRLLYVAITRARQRLFITHAATRTLFGKTRYQSPSGFLRDLPTDGVERRDLSGFDDAGRRPGALASGGAYGASAYGGRAWLGGGRSGAAPGRSAPALRPGERIVERDPDAHDSGEPGRVVRPGDPVFHRRFGQGTVESVEPGLTPTVVATFPGFGTRRIAASYLQFGS